jgi:hypothetical protein
MFDNKNGGSEMRHSMKWLMVACTVCILAGCGKSPDRVLKEYEEILSTNEIKEHFGLVINFQKEVKHYKNRKQRGIQVKWMLEGHPAIKLKIIQGTPTGMKALLSYARQYDSNTRLLPELGKDAHAYVRGTRTVNFIKGKWRGNLEVSKTWLRNHASADALALDRVIELAKKVHARM